MARLFFAFSILSAAVVQATFLPALDLLAILPNVVIVLLLVWSALRGVGEALFWAFGIGIVLDVLALDPLGANALALLAAALLGGLSQQRFFQSSLIVPLALTVVATFLNAVILLLIRSSDGVGIPVVPFFRLVILQSLLNMLFVPPLYVVAAWMNRRVERGYA